MPKNIFLPYFFLITCPQAHYFTSKKFDFLEKFCVTILFCKQYFRKGKDPESIKAYSDPDSVGWTDIIVPNLDQHPGPADPGPKGIPPIIFKVYTLQWNNLLFPSNCNKNQKEINKFTV
jgi:hypothetical protein